MFMFTLLPGIDLDNTASNNLCYTDDMQSDRSFWPEWARFLHHWGVSDIAATLLEATGPVHLVLANLIYAGQPFFRQMMIPGERVHDLASLFEDQSESRSFAAFLREETSA
jgi:hypothetical protein